MSIRFNGGTEPEYCDYCAISMAFDLRETLSSVTYLRRKARAMIESLDVSQQDADDLETILGELATNVVRHAGGGEYHAHIELRENQAIILVVDKGIGFSPDAVPEPGTARPETLIQEAFDRIGGFGLPLVRCIADDLEIKSNPAGGMSVRAAKTLQPKL